MAPYGSFHESNFHSLTPGANLIGIPDMRYCIDCGATQFMPNRLKGHTSTLLPDGRIVVIGGMDSTGRDARAEVHIWDPSHAQWRPGGKLITGRYLHNATLLQDGRIFVSGGQGHITPTSATRTYEVWDPITQRSHLFAQPKLDGGLNQHHAIRLADGRVLLLGTSIEAMIVDPKTGTQTPTGYLNQRRHNATLTALPNGKALVSGGRAILRPTAQIKVWEPLASSELWDPETNTWKLLPSRMRNARYDHGAILRPNGQVWVIGGTMTNSSAVTAIEPPIDEFWDPLTEKWSPLPGKRPQPITQVHSILPLPGQNKIAVFSKENGANIQIRNGNTWTGSGNPILERGSLFSVAPLLDGRLLISGGDQDDVNGYNRPVDTWQTWPASASPDQDLQVCAPTVLNPGELPLSFNLDGKRCFHSEACPEVASMCRDSKCVCEAPSCEDTLKNGKESDVNCGGGSRIPADDDCPRCRSEQTCRENTDCLTGFCNAQGRCQKPVTITDASRECDVPVAGRRCTYLVTFRSHLDTAQPFDPVMEVVHWGQVEYVIRPIRISSGDIRARKIPGHETIIASFYWYQLPKPGRTFRVLTSRSAAEPDTHEFAQPTVPWSCADRQQNNGESDTDCGGTSQCQPCELEEKCTTGLDCASQYCHIPPELGEGTCAAPPANTCADGVRDFGESDTDCGEVCGGNCKLTDHCNGDQDCASGHCKGSECALPGSCDDDQRNGFETDLNCGGPLRFGLECDRCDVGQTCKVHRDCDTGFCDPSGHCNAPTTDCLTDLNCFVPDQTTCDNGIQDWKETDRDCGGIHCGKCIPGDTCREDSDCASGQCDGSECRGFLDSVEAIVSSSAWARNERFVLDLFQTALPEILLASLDDLRALSAEAKKQVRELYNNQSSTSGVLFNQKGDKVLGFPNQDSPQLFYYAEYRNNKNQPYTYAPISKVRREIQTMDLATQKSIEGRIYVQFIGYEDVPTTVTPTDDDVLLADLPSENDAKVTQCLIDNRDTSLAGILANIACYYNRYKNQGEFRFAIPQYLDDNVLGKGVIDGYDLFNHPDTQKPTITLRPTHPRFASALENYDLTRSDLEDRVAGRPVGYNFARVVRSEDFNTGSETFSVFASPSSRRRYPYSTVANIVNALSDDSVLDAATLLGALSQLEDIEVDGSIPRSAASTFDPKLDVARSTRSDESNRASGSIEYYETLGREKELPLSLYTNQIRYWFAGDWFGLYDSTLKQLQTIFPGYNVQVNKGAEVEGASNLQELLEWLENPRIQGLMIDTHGTAIAAIDSDVWEWPRSSHKGEADQCLSRWNEYQDKYPDLVDRGILEWVLVTRSEFAKCVIVVDLPKLIEHIKRTAPHKKGLLILDTCFARQNGRGASELFQIVAGSSGSELNFLGNKDLETILDWTTKPDSYATALDRDTFYLNMALARSLEGDFFDPVEFRIAAAAALGAGKLVAWRNLVRPAINLDGFPRMRSVTTHGDAVEFRFSSLVEHATIDTHVYGSGEAPKPASDSQIVVNTPKACEVEEGTARVAWEQAYNVDGEDYAMVLALRGTNGALGPRFVTCDEQSRAPSGETQNHLDQLAFVEDTIDPSLFVEVLIPPLRAQNGGRLHGNTKSLTATPDWIFAHNLVTRPLIDPRNFEHLWDGTIPTPPDPLKYTCLRPRREKWTPERPSPFRIRIPCVKPPKVHTVTSKETTARGAPDQLEIALTQSMFAGTPLTHLLAPGEVPVEDPERPILNVPVECTDALNATLDWVDIEIKNDIEHSKTLRIGDARHLRPKTPAPTDMCLPSEDFPSRVIQSFWSELETFAFDQIDAPHMTLIIPKVLGWGGSELHGNTTGRMSALVERPSRFAADTYAEFDNKTADGSLDICLAPKWQAPLFDPEAGASSFRLEVPCFVERPAVQSIRSADLIPNGGEITGVPIENGTPYRSLSVSLSVPVLTQATKVQLLRESEEPESNPSAPTLSIPIECSSACNTSLAWGEKIELLDDEYSETLHISGFSHVREPGFPAGELVCDDGDTLPFPAVREREARSDSYNDSVILLPVASLVIPTLATFSREMLHGNLDLTDPGNGVYNIDDYADGRYIPDDVDQTCSAQSWRIPYLTKSTENRPFRVDIPCQRAIAGTGKTILTRRGDSIPNPGLSCQQILNDYPESKNGHYWIDPDGPCGTDGRNNIQPVPTFCDMTTEGGGWTVVNFNQDKRLQIHDERRRDSRDWAHYFTYNTPHFRAVLKKDGEPLRNNDGDAVGIWVVDRAVVPKDGGGSELRFCASTRDAFKLANDETEFRLSENCAEIRAGVGPDKDQVYRSDPDEDGTSSPGFPAFKVVIKDPDYTCDEEKRHIAFGAVGGSHGSKFCFAYRNR